MIDDNCFITTDDLTEITINGRISKKLFEKRILPKLKERESLLAERDLLVKALEEIASQEDGYCRSRYYDIDGDGNQIERCEEFDVVRFATEALAKIRGGGK